MSAFARLWGSLAAWLVLDLILAACWAWHRSREKAREAVAARLDELDRLAAREAEVARDVAAARATRDRLLAAVPIVIPAQRKEGPK